MHLPSGTYSDSYQKDMAIIHTRWQWILFSAFMLALFLFPVLGSTSLVHLLNSIGITLIAVLGLQILTGYTGQISLGHSAFIALGAYSSAILSVKLGLPFWFSLPLSGLITALAGLLIGLPSLRIKGFYLAMATIASQFIIIFVIGHLNITGGPFGMPVPQVKLGNFIFASEKSYYYIILVTGIIMTFIALNITRTRVGRALIAIRDNDLAAELLGINIFYYKLLSFFVASFFAGIAGSLWAHYITVIHPEQFTLTDSIWYLGMIIVGGMGSITGTIFGVSFMMILRELVDIASPVVASAFPAVGGAAFAALGQIVFGLVIVLFLIFEPRGLYHRWEMFKAYYRLHPFSY